MNNKRLIYLAISTALGAAACGTGSVKQTAIEHDAPGNTAPATSYVEHNQLRPADDTEQRSGQKIDHHIDHHMGAAVREELRKSQSYELRKLEAEVKARSDSATFAAPAARSNWPAVQSNVAHLRPPSESVDRESYAHFDDNGVTRVAEQPVSTFSVDVDTGAYSNVRRLLNAGRIPQQDAVRVEELINYFDYAYPAPLDRAVPFSITTELGPNPWRAGTHLLHVGLKGYEVPKSQLPAANLVFLVDVSGSMQSADKLDLLKTSLNMLSKSLRAEDRISIVVYAGASGVVLEPVAGNESAKISSALDSLTAGGSTNGAAGIRLAYAMAEQAYIEGGINRILLATDGDFNVGTTNFEALTDLVEEKRKTGISLTTLGFGTGNYNDQLMEQLADAGNGNYAYIDNLNEARKVLVDQMSSTLQTIAKDVKIQIEFNPAAVAEYRLVGYENRALAREDFNNDNVDAGEIGAGHTVTAIYELVLVDGEALRIDPLRYQPDRPIEAAGAHELAFLKLRYKAPGSTVSKLIEQPVMADGIATELQATTERFRFSAAVAGFGQLLRGGKHTESFDFDDVLQLARSSKTQDPFGYRGEFLQLVALAQTLGSTTAQSAETNDETRQR